MKRLPPLKSDPTIRDTSNYCAFHRTHGHYIANCKAWKRHLEELVRERYCTEFVAKKAFWQIEDRDVAKESPQKFMRINTILVDFEESRMTINEKKRKIKYEIVISQVLTNYPAVEDDLVIGFQNKDMIGLDLPHNDAFVINIEIAQAIID